MRWNKKDPNFRCGATRLRKKFLFLPMRIGQESRWLEFAVIEETAYLAYIAWLTGYYNTQAWKATRFVD